MASKKAKGKGGTRKKMRYIFWDGPGSRTDGIHTRDQFLRIIRDQHPEVVYLRFKGDPPGVPQGKIKKDDLEGWMQFAKASWTNKKQAF